MIVARTHRPARLAAMLFALGLLGSAATFGQPPEAEPPPPRPPHPVIDDLSRLLDLLASNGIPVRADAPREPLYECFARSADPVARVFPPPAYDHWMQELAGRDYSLGISVTVSNALPYVVGLGPDAPADLRAGDRIQAIDGVAATNVTLSDALDLLRGHAATNAHLNVVRVDGSAATVSVARALIELPAIELSEAWPRRLGYARVNGFFDGSATALVALVRGWVADEFAGGILDLRGAGGLAIEEVASFAGLFASPGSLLFSFRDCAENDLGSFKAAAGERLDLPIMALVDEHTRGAAEVFAAAAADSLRGLLLIGRPTAGDPAIRTGLALPGGHTLYIANRRLVTGNGSVFDGRGGVPPHLVVDRAVRTEYEPAPGPDRRIRLEEEDADRALRDRVRGDAALQRAVDVLLGLNALNIKPGARRSPPP